MKVSSGFVSKCEPPLAALLPQAVFSVDLLPILNFQLRLPFTIFLVRSGLKSVVVIQRRATRNKNGTNAGHLEFPHHANRNWEDHSPFADTLDPNADGAAAPFMRPSATNVAIITP